MNFSTKGDLFATYNAKDKKLYLFQDFNSPHDLLKKVSETKTPFLELDDNDQENIKAIDFDTNNKFMALTSDLSLLIINIETKKVCQKYDLNTEVYQMIDAVRIISSSTTDYKCTIATIKPKIKQLCVFDINDEKQSMKLINFTNEAKEERKIQISLDSK